MVASQSLLSSVGGSFEILRVLVSYFRTVGFYLGRGVTWVVCFNGCGLPDLVHFNEVALCFMHLTYVLAVPGYM